MMGEALGLLDETYRRYERGEAQPTLETLATIRRLTGVSLDVLIADEKPGSATIIVLEAKQPNEVTLADRLRWVREATLGSIAEAATLMGVDLVTWARWERGPECPPVELLMTFAHRCGAGLDFLYRGQLTGIAPEVWRRILEAHPELRQAERSADPALELKPTRRRRRASGGGRPDRPAPVVELKPGKR